jgi:cytidylate kinase
MNMRNGFDRQLAYINSRPRSVDQPPESERLAVAISPQTGSGALQIAERLAEYLQARAPHAESPWRVFDRNLMVKVLEDHHHPTRLVELLPEDAHNPVDDMLQELLGLHPPSWVIVQQSIETILDLVRAGNVILMGWGVNAVTRKLPNVFHVRLVGSLEHRVARIQSREHLSRQEALLFIQRRDGGRARYLKKHFHQEVADVLLYGLTINTDHFSDAQVVRLIGDAVMERHRETSAGVRIPSASETLI